MSEPKKRVRCEVYSRVVGYLRPVRNWNAGKRQEFVDRVDYKVKEDEDVKTRQRMDSGPG